MPAAAGEEQGEEDRLEEREGRAAEGPADELVKTLTSLAAEAVERADDGHPLRPEPLTERLERQRRSRRRSTVVVIAVFLLFGLALLWVALRDLAGSLPRVAAEPGGVTVSIGGFPGTGLPLFLLAALVGTLYLWLRPGDSGKALAALGAVPAGRETLPVAHGAVEDMAIALGLRRRPDLYLIRTPALNAFIAGRALETAAIAVTSGLVEAMPPAEQRAVVAHLFARLLIGRAASSAEDGAFEEQADALAMETLRDPEALLAALERVRDAETIVLIRGVVTNGFFFAQPIPRSPLSEYVWDRRIASLRAVLGAAGAAT